MMHYIALVVLGLIAGGIAKMIIGGSNPSGWIITAVLGIAGAFLGHFIASDVLHLGSGAGVGFNISSLASAVIGAIILLLIYHFVQKAMGNSDTSA
jgi:uncharacterized membrane protein YeaQ/YmgE (transglycosylase-associated protein family)